MRTCHKVVREFGQVFAHANGEKRHGALSVRLSVHHTFTERGADKHRLAPPRTSRRRVPRSAAYGPSVRCRIRPPLNEGRAKVAVKTRRVSVQYAFFFIILTIQ